MITIIAAVSFAVFFTMTNLYQSFGLNFKPFSCTPCLSTWSAIVLIVIPIQYQEWIAIVFSSGILGAVIFRLINKL
jgi:hypothetical protein